MLPAIIGAIGSIASGLIGKSSADKAAQANADSIRETNASNERSVANTNATNRKAALLTNKTQLKMNAKNIALQKEFARSGIQWKVRDAIKAGIHPLAALGAQTISFAPQAVGLDTPVAQAFQAQAPGGDESGVNPLPDLGAMGQNIGSALMAASPIQAQMEAVQLALGAAQVEGAGLDNDIKRAELASLLGRSSTSHAPGVPLAVPNDEFGGVSGDHIRYTQPTVDYKTRRDVADPRRASNVVGHGPSVAFVKTSTGGFEPVMPPELAESYESDWIGSLGWQLKNRLLPNLVRMPPPNVGQKPGDVVRWNSLAQEWEIIKPTTRFPDPYGG